MNRFYELLWVALFAGLLSGCAADDYSRPEFDRFKQNNAGETVLRSLVHQGYAEWQTQAGMVCSIRSMQMRDNARITKIDQLSFDLDHDRIHGRTHRGAAIVEHAFSEKGFWETVDGEPVKDKRQLDAACRELVDDYLFTALPFLVGRHGEAFELEKPEVIDRVRYNVLIARFPGQSRMPPDTWYRLYFTHSTNRLQKVLYLAASGPNTGKYIWCEFDNYANFDGTLFPLHRVFTFAESKSGVKKSKPFLNQWVYDVEFESIDADLFQTPGS